MADIAQLMKQAQEMKAKMEAATAELSKEVFTAESGWGAITASVRIVNGHTQLKELKMKPECLEKGLEFIQETTMKAVNQASLAAQKAAEKKMNAVAGPLKGMLG